MLVSQRASQLRRHIYHRGAGNSPAPAHYVLINNLLPHSSSCKENEVSCCDTALKAKKTKTFSLPQVKLQCFNQAQNRSVIVF